MSTFRKKPVEIEARLWLGVPDSDIELWLGDAFESWVPADKRANAKLLIRTLEGEITASAGDWIIRGVQGEFYPCKPDIFEATYETVVPDVVPTGDPVQDAAIERFFTASEHEDVVALRNLIVPLGAEIARRVPKGRNQALALTALEDVQMRANRGIFAPEHLR